MRYLSVRERSIVTLTIKLLSIRTENGFNYTVNDVHRPAKEVWDSMNPPELYLFFGRDRQASPGGKGTDNIITEVLPFQVRFFTSSWGIPDREHNMLRVDIQRTLQCDPPIRDETSEVGAPQEEIFIEWLSGIPSYTPRTRETEAMGILDYEMKYRYLQRDPRLWSDQDVLVPEDKWPVRT